MILIEDVTQKLGSLGYTVIEADSWLIDFTSQKVENNIKNQCNISEVPQGLREISVDMVVGEFLLAKKSMGQLTGFDLDAAVKSIQEGDTNVTFAIGSGSKTPEERIDALIGFLLHPETNFASYRCIKW